MPPVQLKLNNVGVHYGPIQAVNTLSFDVREGELVTLLGSNGAGKSTAMRAISGLVPLSSGTIFFEGQDISKMKAHKRVKAGIVQAPEGRGIFPGMTVAENLEMGCYGRKFKSRAERRERLDWINALFPRLAERRHQPGARCPAVSSRCCRSAVRSWPGPRSCSWTNRRWAWHRC